MTVNTFDQQALSGFTEALNNLGVTATYKNAAAATKDIKVMFDNREAQVDDDPVRVVSEKPIIYALSSDIDDTDTDVATFTIGSTVYYADQYIDDNKGVIEISLRL